MSDDDVMMRELTERLKNAVSEQAEVLKRVDIIRGLDGFLSGYLIAVLFYTLKKDIFDVMITTFEKYEDGLLKKFGKDLGFIGGFLTFGRTTVKRKSPLTDKLTG